MAIIGRMRAAHAEQRRGVVDCREPRRIAGLFRGEQADAERVAGGELGAGIFLAADPDLARCAAALGEIRQPLQRGPRAAAMCHKRSVCPRPDIVGADQSQPVDPLGIGDCGGDGVHACLLAGSEWINLSAWGRGHHNGGAMQTDQRKNGPKGPLPS
jgi:hypothetical protein